jgi:hypothetical protein
MFKVYDQSIARSLNARISFNASQRGIQPKTRKSRGIKVTGCQSLEFLEIHEHMQHSTIVATQHIPYNQFLSPIPTQIRRHNDILNKYTLGYNTVSSLNIRAVSYSLTDILLIHILHERTYSFLYGES